MRGMVRHRLDIPVEDLREFTTSAQYALLGELSKLLCSSPEDVTPPPQSAISMAAKPLLCWRVPESPLSLCPSPTAQPCKKEATRKDHIMKGKSAELYPTCNFS